MDFLTALRDFPLILTEGSILERLRRDPAIGLDSLLLNAPLTLENETPGADALAALHERYIGVARRAGLPILCGTDTWRASFDRIERAGLGDADVNGAAVRFLAAIRARQATGAPPILIAGVTGPCGDAYRPEEALTAEDAARYHQGQVESLARAGVDLMMAVTLPALSEAKGIARAMSRTGLPYVLSFVIRRSGALLDGTPLTRAAVEIDALCKAHPPAGYMVNCVHPSVLSDAAGKNGLPDRFLGIQANASPKSPEELDNCATLESDAPEPFAADFAALAKTRALKVVGGCCGTDERHIEALARALS